MLLTLPSVSLRSFGSVRENQTFIDVAVPEAAASGGKKGLSVGAIVAICVSAFLASKLFLGTLCYCRWKKMNSTCEVKLSGS